MVLEGAGYYGFGGVGVVGGEGEHVDFVADAEFSWVVEAWFYGEAGVGEEEAVVVGFEVVEVGSVAVEGDGYVVSGAVGEVVGNAGGTEEVAGGVVGLVAGYGDGWTSTCGCVGLLDGFDGGVAGVADEVED